MKPEIEYLSDNSVTDREDSEIRGLLTTCFTKPQDVVFREQRFFREPYPNRWIIRNENCVLIAHIGVHEKQVAANDGTYRIGGIAEVCVHPDYRGRAYVKMMLRSVHAWLSDHGFTYALLFGSASVYASSGYKCIGNLVHGGEMEGWRTVGAMVKELAGKSWPEGTVKLPGPTF